MFRLLRLLRTSIGKKLVMALTGLILVGFVVGHMIGNLKVFQGADSLNGYAAWLQGNPLLWGIRLFMLAFFAVHILTALRLVLGNRAARPRAYAVRTSLQTNLAARTMALSGVLVLAFVIYHLLHLTVGVVQPETAGLIDSTGRPDIYSRVVLAFTNPWIAGLYGAGVLLVGVHLQHAISSLVRTLGFSHEGYHQAIDYAGTALALLVVAGFLAIPVAVQLGLVRLPGGSS